MTSRDAGATRQAILDAAKAEYSAHGFAGARIERIAAASGRNRALIYAHFGDKAGLLNAIFEQLVAETGSRVPLDPERLPEYAAALFEEVQRQPEAVRVAEWDRLERDLAGTQSQAVLDFNASKVQAIAGAQAAGSVASRVAADEILDIIITLSRMQGRKPQAEVTEEVLAARRDAIYVTVAALTQP